MYKNVSFWAVVGLLEYNLGLGVGSHWITYVVLARAPVNWLSPVVPRSCL